jgi:hypothetical protein
MRSSGKRAAFGLGWVACASWAGAARADLNLPDPDVTPPNVSIVAPTPSQVLAAGMPVVVDMLAEDPPPESSGVAEVWLEIDGEPRLDLLDDEAPWSLSVPLEPGTHTVRAFARDWEGNEASSEVVTFSVDAPAGQDDSGGGSGNASSGEGEGSSAEADGGSTEAEPLDRGCACASRGAAGSAAWSGLLVLALGLRARPVGGRWSGRRLRSRARAHRRAVERVLDRLSDPLREGGLRHVVALEEGIDVERRAIRSHDARHA